METISTTSRSEAIETDTQSGKNEALGILEGLRSPVGSRTPNRELRDYFLDGILLPNGDPGGVHFCPRANFDRFFSDFGTDRKRSKKTLISRTFQKRESRGRYSVYTRICTIICTHLCGVGAQNDDFWVPSKTQEFPKMDPWRVQVRPKSHKKGGAKKNIQRFVGEVSAEGKTANGGETAPFSKAVHVAFVQGLLWFFERTLF